MRKFLPAVVILSVISVFLPVRGQEFSEIDTLSIARYDGFPGDTLVLPIDLVNTFHVAGFEFRISYDTSAFLALSVELAERDSTFDLFGPNLTEPGIIGFFATSMDPRENAFPPGIGAVANVTLAVKETSPSGEFDLEFVSEDSDSYDNSLTDTNSVLIIPLLANGAIEVFARTGFEGNATLPARLDLSQNYPNPFNMRTVISFQLDNPGHVDLEVYDVTGRRVIAAYSGQAKAGENRISWDGRGSAGEELGSGVFFYRLKTTWGESVTKRMTLLK